MQSLKPTGLPPESSRSRAMNCIISSGVEKAEWRAGEMQSCAVRHAARRRDLGADLGRRQHAAVAGLGALAQLDLDHLDLRWWPPLGELLGREAAVGLRQPK